MTLKLIVGSKNYSSWSMRPWLALAHHNIPFEEVVVALDTPQTAAAIRRYTPASKVPVLIDGEMTLWESIAILIHLSERFPEARLWPSEKKARAQALTISCEMHSGFAALRQQCPMNIKRRKKRELSPEAVADIRRISEMWRDARERFGQGGEFLFGAFSAADCMYAPVATRIRSYEIDVDPISAAYVETIYALPAFKRWQEGALQEAWGHATTDAIA
ncbi:MAG TPA: glutathione S-transferase family protein [Xanthobacteraceae bacterium]|nr:glutathione S-transferase family protein [Xanthobacteraceae bacterium]